MSSNNRWRLVGPREQKIREPKMYIAKIVLEKDNNDVGIIYAHNSAVLDYIVKLHNASLEKTNEDRRSK